MNTWNNSLIVGLLWPKGISLANFFTFIVAPVSNCTARLKDGFFDRASIALD